MLSLSLFNLFYNNFQFFFQSKKVMDLIDQTSANAVQKWLPHAAKAKMNYAKSKVNSGDPVDSEGSKFLQNSLVSEEDNVEDKKKAKSKSPSRRDSGPPLPVIHTDGNCDDELDDNVDDASTI